MSGKLAHYWAQVTAMTARSDVLFITDKTKLLKSALVKLRSGDEFAESPFDLA
jgi:hypothetical protein